MYESDRIQRLKDNRYLKAHEMDESGGNNERDGIFSLKEPCNGVEQGALVSNACTEDGGNPRAQLDIKVISVNPTSEVEPGGIPGPVIWDDWIFLLTEELKRLSKKWDKEE